MGYEDLRHALEESQHHGAGVHLWGVEAAAPEYNQIQSLIADRQWVIQGEWVKRFVRPRVVEQRPDVVPPLVTGEPTAPPGGEAPTKPLPVIGDPVESPVLASAADLERLASSFDRKTPHSGSDDLRGWTMTEASHDDVPRLREITSSGQAWQDNEDDATAPGRTLADLGQTFAQRWAARATDGQRRRLLALHPMAPRHLDGELLRYAEHLGVDTWEDDDAKMAVRTAFWRSIEGVPKGPAPQAPDHEPV